MKSDNFYPRRPVLAVFAVLTLLACIASARAELIPRVCVEKNGGKGTVRLTANAAQGSNSLLVDGTVPRNAFLIFNSDGSNPEQGVYVESVSESNPLLLNLSTALTQSYSAGDTIKYELSELEFHFGYYNSSDQTVHVPKTIQNKNFFVPSPLFYPDQPEDFQPGIHEDVVTITFRAQGFNYKVWILDEDYVSATSDSPPCANITYQGRLTDANAAANGQYDLRFTVFDRPTGGTAQTNALVIENVPVTNGIFTVNLNFGSALINSFRKFLEIAVRPGTSTGAFTVLAPRQQITNVPYAATADLANRAITADNATQLNGLAADKYVLTTDPRLSQASSTNFIQNTTTQQTGSFNISGSGTIGGNLTVNGLLNATLPAGSANYVQNTTTQQTGNFNISGSGTIGGNLTVGGTINGTVANATNATNAANAAQLGGVAANQYLTVTGANTSFIQNTTTQQTGSFNISGSGTTGGNLTVGGTVNANAFSGNGAGLTGILTVYSLSNILGDAIPANESGYTFIGQTQTITLTANKVLTGTGSIPLAVSSGTQGVSVGLCYQIGAGAIANFAGGTPTNTIVDTTYKIYAASATVQPGAGQITFGLCVGKNSQPLLTNSVNGWVMVTNK